MPEVCPLPPIWSRIYQHLLRRWKESGEIAPPIPLILGGWGSSDLAKRERWDALKQ